MTVLPHDALTQLRLTHAAGVKLLNEQALSSEAESIAIQVESHRWFWRPRKPRILLVAESHVFTSAEDHALTTDNEKLRQFSKKGATAPPNSFVRLVYCLGYGESEILTNAPDRHRNPGTRNYWDIFGRVTNRLPQPLQDNGDHLDRRLRWKIETLRQLCRQGIWLLDAAVHAIYLGYGNRLPTDIQHLLHRQWWEGYGRHVIAACEGAKIWVIGKTVYECLHSLPQWKCRGWVYQPNYDTETNWPDLLADCGAARIETGAASA